MDELTWKATRDDFNRRAYVAETPAGTLRIETGGVRPVPFTLYWPDGDYCYAGTLREAKAEAAAYVARRTPEKG